MGKYMKKGKVVGEVAVMEVSQGGFALGVRTRARTLASQRERRLGATSSKSSTGASPRHNKAGPCFESASMHTQYLELRSRKLQKIISRCQHHEATTTTAEHDSKKSEQPSRMALSEGDVKGVASDDRSSGRAPQRSSVAHSRNNSATFSYAHSNAKKTPATRRRDPQNFQASEVQDVEIRPHNDDPMEVEASFGENVMDLDSRERRTTRETTPSSHRREVETMETPGSTTRPAPPSSGRRRPQNQAQSHSYSLTQDAAQPFHLPTSNEIEDFFAGAEQQEQRRFTERYNYDPVSDLPLPGRFEWFRLRP